MTPEEIVGQLAGMTDPYESSDPFDSDESLARLIREARKASSPRARRRASRVYLRQRADFTRAMLRVLDAPADHVRDFVMETIDLLWGVGSVTRRRGARRLDFEKVWEVETIEEVALALSQSSFSPFPEPPA